MKKLMLYYEDSGALGLHNLVLSCIADRAGDPALYYRALGTRFVANPRNGRDNVLAACRDDACDLGGQYWGAVGVLDGDEVHVPFGLSPHPCKIEVRGAFERLFGHPRTALFVIDSNTETILEAVANEVPISPGLFDLAVRAKKRPQREQMLFRAADAPDRRVRDGILSRVASFQRLVDKLSCAHAIWSADEP